MNVVWFWLVAVMIAMYVIFDGFDIGVGILHLFVARDDAERRRVIATIGPVWNGNEVWLLAGGGALFCAFPALYASGFSGCYLPLMMVLWLLILRGISLEFRSHVGGDLWPRFWDVTFCGASLMLAIVYGAALGNVVRGVPLDNEGFFFLPLWTDFLPGAEPGVLDWYTVLVGIAALLAISLHGALWLIARTTGAVQQRCRDLAAPLWLALGALIAGITVASFAIQPHLKESFAQRPWGFAFPVLAIASFLAIRQRLAVRDALGSFLSSCLFLVGMLTSAVFGLFPYVLPSSGDPARSLTVDNAAASTYGLTVALIWWVPAMALTSAYFLYSYRTFWKPAAGEAGIYD